MGDYLPLFSEGAEVTFTAATDLTGGALVDAAPLDRHVTTAAAGGLPTLGVAATDTAAGEKVLVHCGGVQRIKASAAISAGAAVFTGPDGTVAPTGTKKIGTALTSATINTLVQVKMHR